MLLFMAKKGIKIEELARQLGVTSRQLIDRCREGGMAVQNSVTKLNVESERQVRRWFDPSASDAESQSGSVDRDI